MFQETLEVTEEAKRANRDFKAFPSDTDNHGTEGKPVGTLQQSPCPTKSVLSTVGLEDGAVTEGDGQAKGIETAGIEKEVTRNICVSVSLVPETLRPSVELTGEFVVPGQARSAIRKLVYELLLEDIDSSPEVDPLRDKSAMERSFREAIEKKL